MFSFQEPGAGPGTGAGVVSSLDEEDPHRDLDQRAQDEGLPGQRSDAFDPLGGQRRRLWSPVDGGSPFPGRGSRHWRESELFGEDIQLSVEGMGECNRK